MAVVTFSNIKGGGGGAPSGITFLNSDYSLEFIESAVTEAVDSAMTGYTKTEDFATINGSAITEGGNIEIETGGNYSAGTNIDITDDVISVTGITVPTKVSDLENDEGYITGITSGDVTDALGFTPISGVDLSDYYTSAQTNTAIENAVSGKMDTSAMSAYSTTVEVEGMISSATSGFATEQYVNNAVSGKMDTSGMTAYATTAFTEQTYLKEHQSLAGLFDSVNYVSSAKTIYFYDKDNTEVGTIDTTDFVKDGMVDNVYVSGDTLYIVFNTDAGKETIEIPLTDIFDPSNYYTKDEVDSAITAATAATTGWVSEQGYLTEHQSLSAYSTTVEVEEMISGFTTSGDVKTQIESYNYVNSGDVKSQIEAYNYVNSGDVATQINDATSGLASTTYVDNSVSGKADISSLSAYTTSADVETQITEKGYVTSGEVETQITDKGYITGYTETDPVFQASPASGISAQDILDWDAKLDSSDLEPYYTSAQTDTAISNATSGLASTTYVDNAVSGKVDTSAMTEYYTSAQTDTQIANATSALASTTYVDNSVSGKADSSALTQFYTSAQTDTQIANAVSGKQDTLISGTNIKTINNESILGSGNIVISGGSGGSANIIELTQAEYDALTAYTQDAMYVITDAEEINLDGYVTSGDLQSYYTSAQTDTQISNAVSGKANAASVTANTGRQFPRWNSQGVVTGTTGNTVYERNFSVNGNSKTMLQTTNSDLPSIYAPTTAGSAGQPLLSNGSGAPVWGSYKFQFLSQSQYDALATKDSTTIYFIVNEN